MGSIYKRGKIYWIQYYSCGKPFRESSRSTREIVAKRLLRKREGETSEGKLPGVVYDKVTFEDLIQDYLTDYTVNEKKSYKWAERIVRLHLAPFFEGYKVPAITTSRIRAYIAHRKNEGAANATINRELSALKRMHNLAFQSTPPKVQRVPYIPMLKENNIRKGFFEHKEFLKVKKALPDYLKPFFTFAYMTGMRRGEISNLKWVNIDLNQGIVRLETGETKSNEGRFIYMDERLCRLLRQQFINRRLDCLYVFHREGQKVGDFRNSWKRALKDAGVTKKHFHDLRRTAIRNMIRAGIPEDVAMAISGHKTRSVFSRYNIVDSEDLKIAARKLETYLEAVQTQKKTH